MRFLALMFAAAWLGACAAPGDPVVEDRWPGAASATADARKAQAARSGVVEVVRGDTLYSLSRITGVSVQRLAALNGLRPPYRIFPGQKLKLRGQAQPPARRPRTPPIARRPAAKKPTPAPSQSPPTTSGGVTWSWPTSRSPVGEFGSDGGLNKGMAFSLARNDRVRSAGAGEVIYAGAGLAGFRHLVIVRHNAVYMSAYSLNQRLSVREGQSVSRGQTLSTMTRSGPSAYVMHFEIRRNGQPINPRSIIM